jgi:RNA-directed DNA polymerase
MAPDPYVLGQVIGAGTGGRNASRRNAYGFRPKHSAADAIEQSFNALAQKQSAQWVFEGDIKACFDQISHPWLIANIPMDKPILEKWLAAGFMEDGIVYPTMAGTTQGGIASPVLTNMALDGLEVIAQSAAPRGQKIDRRQCRHQDG